MPHKNGIIADFDLQKMTEDFMVFNFDCKVIYNLKFNDLARSI